MKAYVLLGLAFAAPALAQAPIGRSPDEAAKIALGVCSEHADATTPIEGKSGKQLDAKGVIWQINAPEFLASTKATTMGIAEYAKSPSTVGEVWAAGYDSSGCMVVTLGAPVDEVEKGYLAYFAENKKWRSQRPNKTARAGEKLLGYGWNPRRNLKLTAIISLQPETNTTTVTIVRSTG
jgi:hypothetical protein